MFIKSEDYYSKSFIGKIFEFITGIILIIICVPLIILYNVGTFAGIAGNKIEILNDHLCKKYAEFFN